MNPLLRSTSLGFRPLALGVSVAVHAAVFAAATGSPGRTNLAAEDVVGVDVLTDPAPPIAPDPLATVGPPAARAANGPPEVHSNVVSRSHGGPTLARAPSASGSAPAAPSNATNDDIPHFAMAIGAATDGSRGVVSPSRTAGPGEGAGASRPDDSIDVRARLVRGVVPPYPPAARAEGVEGDVVLEIVVGVSGSVESARVVDRIGHGFDEAALRAAYEFRFAPASKRGQPVRVRMPWPVRFRLE